MYTALDALRGLSAIAIVAFHAHAWLNCGLKETFPSINKWGEFVSLFCVLSGFVIYGATQRRKNQDWLSYYKRRFFRIYPLYFATLVPAAYFTLDYRNDWQSWLSEIFMLKLIGYSGFNLPPTWSLFTEVAFYLTFPAYYLLSRSRQKLWAVAAVLVLSLMGGAWGATRETMLWKYFAMGILTYEITLTQKLKRFGLVLFGIGCLGWGYELSLPYTQKDFLTTWLNLRDDSGFTVLQGLASMCLVLGAVHSRLVELVLRPLKHIGTISYSVYLVHPFVLIAGTNIRFDGRGGITNANLPWGNPFVSTSEFFWVLLPKVLFVSLVTYLLIEWPCKHTVKDLSSG